MKTALDDFADQGRAALAALAPIVAPNVARDLDDSDQATEIVFGALVALLHVCHAKEVDFEGQLRAARELVAGDLREDSEMQSEAEGEV